MKRLGVLIGALLIGACATPKEMNKAWAVGVRTGVATQDAGLVDRDLALGGVTVSYFPAPQVEIQAQFDGGVANSQNENAVASKPDVDSSQWASRFLAIYNIDTGGGLVPYLGVGGGVTRVTFQQTNGVNDRGFDPTYGAIGGVRLFLSEDTALDGGIQYNRLVQDEALGEGVDEVILFLGLTHIF